MDLKLLSILAPADISLYYTDAVRYPSTCRSETFICTSCSTRAHLNSYRVQDSVEVQEAEGDRGGLQEHSCEGDEAEALQGEEQSHVRRRGGTSRSLKTWTSWMKWIPPALLLEARRSEELQCVGGAEGRTEGFQLPQDVTVIVEQLPLQQLK